MGGMNSNRAELPHVLHNALPGQFLAIHSVGCFTPPVASQCSKMHNVVFIIVVVIIIIHLHPQPKRRPKAKHLEEVEDEAAGDTMATDSQPLTPQSSATATSSNAGLSQNNTCSIN